MKITYNGEDTYDDNDIIFINLFRTHDGEISDEDNGINCALTVAADADNGIASGSCARVGSVDFENTHTEVDEEGDFIT